PLATTASYTLSLHDALPISISSWFCEVKATADPTRMTPWITNTAICTSRNADGNTAKANTAHASRNEATTVTTARLGSRRPNTADRKSTRLNSSHDQISYAV